MNQFLKFLFLLLPSFILVSILPNGAGHLFAQKPASAQTTAGRHGQALIDSLLKELPKAKEDTDKVKRLNGLAYTYASINPDDGIQYGAQALALAAKLDWKKGIATADNWLGINYLSKSDYPGALEYDLKALKIDEETGDKKGIANVAEYIGEIYSDQNDHPKALEYEFKALKINNEIGYKPGIAAVNLSIGNIYSDQFDNVTALDYYFKALKMGEEIGEKDVIITSTSNIGDIYSAQKKYTTAVVYMQKALKMAREIGNKYLEAGNLGNIGGCFLYIIKDTAHHSGTRETKNKEPGNSYSTSIPAGKAVLLRSAIDYLQQCLAICKEIDIQDPLLDCYQNLAEAYKMSGDYKLALHYTEEARAINDSIFSKVNSEKIARLEYEGARQADSLKAGQARKITDLELQHQRNYIYMGLAVIALLTFFSFFIAKERMKSEKLLLNILPSEVAKELKSNGITKAKQYDNVTVLFTDFVNFTEAGERMKPQALIDELHSCFKTFDEITGKYRIEKIKTIGDAYLAVAGLPTADPQHAEHIVRAATEINTFMQDRLAKLGNGTFNIRIGIHSGSVVAGIVGIKKFAYDIWGDTVNTAARMEQNSEPGKINISETTWELIKDKIPCTYRGEIEAKGKGMLKMYFVG